MSDDVFRIVVAVAVALACISFVVQAAILLAFYRTVRSMQEKALPLIDRVGPVVAKMEPLVDRVAVLSEKAVPVIEKSGPLIDQIGQRIGPIAEKINALLVTLNAVAAKTDQIAASTNRLLEETRPSIVEASEQAVAIVKSGREQVERIGGVVEDASGRLEILRWADIASPERLGANIPAHAVPLPA